MIAPLPDDEAQRLDALRRFDILDTPPEEAFDDLTRLASQICGTPIALITLADGSRHWFKSKIGMDLSETPREAAFCEYAIAEQDLCVVSDAGADERFATNPMVVFEPYIRFYAGVPLRSPDGFVLGTLCVLDTVPHELTQVQADALRALGRQVMAQLELRRHAASREKDLERAREALRQEGALRDRFMESATDAMVALDLEGRFTLVNRRACEMAGRSEDELLGTWFAEIVPPDAVAGVVAEFSRVTTEHASVERYEADVVRPDGSVVTVAFNIAPLLQDGKLIGAAATAEDITERRRSRDALRRSEARYRALVESAPDGIVEVDDRGRIVSVNGETHRLFGYESDELIGQPVTALMPERFRKVHAAHEEDYARNPTVRTMKGGSELVGRRKDGSEFPVEINLSPARGGGATFAMAIIRDITGRKRAEDALRENEARYRALAENAFDLVCELDSEGRFAYVSPNFKTLLGYEPAAMIGEGAFSLIHPEDRERVGQEYAGAIADPAAGTIAFRFLRSDGTWTWLEVSANIFTNDTGESRAVIVARDATARIAIEAKLRESEARYRDLIENANDIVYTHDLQGNFTSVNEAGLRTYGLKAEDVATLNIRDIVHPGSLPVAVEKIQSKLSGEVERSEAYELLTQARDGTPVWVEVSTRVLRADGKPAGVQGIARDITERKRVEDALRESEERLRTFVENAPLILFGTDREGVFTLFDGKGVEPLGVARGQYVGESIFDAMAGFPDITDGARRALAGEAVTYLFRGERAALEVHHSPVRDAAGEILGTIGLVINVSDRLRAEDELRQSEERLRTVVGNVPVILFATDREGVYTLSEGAGLRSAGLKPGQVVGQSIFDVYPGLPQVVDGARRALAGEAVTYLLRVGGVAMDIQHSPVRDPAGGITGTIGVAVDVSDRIGAVEALRRSEERYRAIYETHRVVRLLIDPATGLIEEANQAASDFYGYTVEEMAGMPISTISTTPPDQILDTTREARDGGTSVVQRTHRLKSGEIRDVELFASPVEVEGRTLLYGIAQDVTERRWAESLVGVQRQLLEMVAVGAPLVDVLERTTHVFEEHAPGAICSVLLVSADGSQLLHAAAPSLPAAYAQAIDGVVIGPAVGSCGTAAYLRKEVVVEDIASDPLWADYRSLALEHGLRSCWSTPILSATGEVLATFAVYHREPGGVRVRERSLLEIVTHVAGIAIERKRAEDTVRSRAAELERMYRRLSGAHAELEESKQHLEEKSLLLERALELERERSRHDQLTGTLNHAAIADTIRELIRENVGRSLAIAMVDVDGLKAANDTYGHQVGDAVLVLVAQKLLRDGAIVGRYGGAEFVAILRGADRKAAEEYRDGVMASLADAGLTDAQTGAHVPVVASIGLAVYPEEAEAVDDLIRLSDNAMYASRRHRVAEGGGDTLSRSLGGDRAAKMVGEIVPLLTSPGVLADKLRLVSHRLSVGAGYDGVSFVMDGRDAADPALSAFARTPQANLQEWNELRRDTYAGPIDEVLHRTMRPVIIDDLETTGLLVGPRRRALVGVGLRSALIAPMIWEDQMIGALSVASKQRDAFTMRDVEFVAAVATQVTAIVRMSSLVEDLQVSTSQLLQAHEGTVLMLASAAEAHDHTTGRHLQRVREITEAIARELGYDGAGANALGMAAILHDIGKIRVPDSVLGSSNSLAEAEWVLMKQHTLWGAAFLADQPGFELAASVARHHHERWDGAGYPDGLAGDDIPESALITTVADSFDAMTNNRPYRRGRPVEEAVREIQSCSGTQFSPRVVDALVRLFEQGELAFVHPDEDELAAA